MKRAIPALLLAALSLPALAQYRPDSLRMSCAEARGLVLRSGAIVLGSGPLVYERYVATATFCPVGSYTRRAHTPTRDNPACYVGEQCINDRPTWFFRGS